MIHQNVSIQVLYSRIKLALNLVDDRELANIYEFSGWALRELGIGQTMKTVHEDVNIIDYRIMMPTDLFKLKQICYDGVPMTYSSQTYDYLMCDSCFNDSVQNEYYVRRPRVTTGIKADFNSDDGVQVVNVNQVVKVVAGYNDGGIAGHYYQRLNYDLPATNLASVDYTTVEWTDISTSVDVSDVAVVYNGVSPYDATYKITPGWIKTNVEEAEVTLIYDAIPTDSNGFFMIPDDEQVLWAMEYYNKIRLIGRGYKFPEENLEICKYEWMKYRDMARSNAERMSLDQMDNFMKRWIRPLAVLDRNQNFYKNEY